jgi:hypothetical protein
MFLMSLCAFAAFCATAFHLVPDFSLWALYVKMSSAWPQERIG